MSHLRILQRSCSVRVNSLQTYPTQGNIRCICQQHLKDKDSLNSDRNSAWYSYVKLRKYGQFGHALWSTRRALSSNLLSPSTASRRVPYDSSNGCHHYSHASSLRFFSSDSNESKGSEISSEISSPTSYSTNRRPPSQSGKRQRKRKPDVPPPPVPVPPPLASSYSSLPDDIRADLQSLSHLVGSENTKRSLDPQDFSAVSTKIIEEFLTESNVPYEKGHTCFYMKCPRFVKARAVTAPRDFRNKTGCGCDFPE